MTSDGVDDSWEFNFQPARSWLQINLPPIRYTKFKLTQIEFLKLYVPQTESTSEFANMDWINCNSCCRQPGDERERTFALTSCGHIFCDLCVSQTGSQDKCITCNSQCQMMQLSSKMKADAEMFFLEPGELLKRHYSQITRVLEFQKEHRVRLVSFHRRALQKYRDLQKQNSSTANQVQELEKKYSAATNRIQELEAENLRLRSLISSPGGPGTPKSLYASHSPQKSPTQNQMCLSQDGTRISPGRLTLVKAGQVATRSGLSPTNYHSSFSSGQMQGHVASIMSPPNIPQTSQVVGHGSRTYISQSPSLPGHHSQRHISSQEDLSHAPKLAGGVMYRNPSPVQNCSISPTRTMPNSLCRPGIMAHGQQQVGSKPFPYPSYISPPHYLSNPDLRSLPQTSRSLTPRSATPNIPMYR